MRLVKAAQAAFSVFRVIFSAQALVIYLLSIEIINAYKITYNQIMTARLPQSDPRLAAISIAAMATPAVCKEQLHSQALRIRFTQQKVWTPELTDETIQSVAYQDPSKRKIAAVLIPLIQNKDQLSVLLTQRSAHLKDHAGQISFPGGRKEATDQDALATAMREAEEEIGLASSCIEPLGHLPDYFTVTGYQVTPVVALVSLQQQLKADAQEVDSIFEVPLDFLMNPANHQVREWDGPRGRRRFYAMPYEDRFIWGATAGMLRNLYHFLNA